eukprot:gene31291-38661_t
MLTVVVDEYKRSSEFNFPLNLIGTRRITQLETRLDDAQNDIEALRLQAVAPAPDTPLLVLVSNKVCGGNEFVEWNRTLLNKSSAFEVSHDLKQVVIRKAGVYQVTVRLNVIHNEQDDRLRVDPHPSLHTAFALYRNSGIQAEYHNKQTVSSDNLDAITTCELTEIIQLNAGNTLSIVFLHN